jgi:hypothetical protein
MTDRDWRPIGNIHHSRLIEARLQAHTAVQWLARAARAYIPPKADDSHTNLGWDYALKSFTTHALKGGAQLGLRISDLTLLMLDGPQPGLFPLDGCTDSHARKWLGEQLGMRGIDAAALDAPAPYEISENPVTRGAPYDASGQKDALLELSAWFGNANHALSLVRHQMKERKLMASAVRCWPHHFDLATLTLLDEPGAANLRSVNAGFSPGDEHYQEPYFYVSPYPYPDAAALPMPTLGHWHTHEFTAAVAPAGRIVAAKVPQRDAEAFLREAIEACIAVLK